MTDSVAVFPPGFRLTLGDGTPIPGASIEFYDEDSTNPREVFSDLALTSTLGSVVYTDSEGYPVTAEGGSTRTLVYTGTGTYKIVIKDADDVTFATHDPCQGAPVTGTQAEEDSGITQAQADVRYVRNANALSAETSVASADLFPFWDASGSANKGITADNLRASLISLGQTAGDVFNSGDTTTFFMASAPAGWTKVTTHNDKTIKITSGDGGTSGGSSGFATVFASRTPTGTVGTRTITITTMPSHSHVVDNQGTVTRDSGGSGTAGSGSGSSSSVGGSDPHDHGWTGNAMNFDVNHIVMIIATKD